MAGLCAVMNGTVENVTINKIQIDSNQKNTEKMAVGIYAGVIVGKSTLKNNLCDGTIKIQYTDEEAYQNSVGILIGGIAAQINTDQDVNIVTCSIDMKSQLKTYSKFTYIGGLIGQLYNSANVEMKKNYIVLENQRLEKTYAVYEGGLVGDANQKQIIAETNQVKHLKENLFGAVIGINPAENQQVSGLVVDATQQQNLTTVALGKNISSSGKYGYSGIASGPEFEYVNKLESQLSQQGFIFENHKYQQTQYLSGCTYDGGDVVESNSSYNICDINNQATINKPCNQNAVCTLQLFQEQTQNMCKCKQGYIVSQGQCQQTNCIQNGGFCNDQPFLCDYSKTPSVCVDSVDKLGQGGSSNSTTDDDGKKHNKVQLSTPIIIVIVVAAVLLVLSITFGILYCYNRKHSNDPQDQQERIIKEKEGKVTKQLKLNKKQQREIEEKKAIDEKALVVSKIPITGIQIITQQEDSDGIMGKTQRKQFSLSPEDLEIKSSKKLKKAITEADKVQSSSVRMKKVIKKVYVKKSQNKNRDDDSYDDSQ